MDRLTHAVYSLTTVCLLGIGALVVAAGWITRRWNRRRP